MKRIFIFSIVCLLTVCSYSQEHIKFNGATFGLPLNEFIHGFYKMPSKSTADPPKGYDYYLCNHNAYYLDIESNTWTCHIFSSKITDTVFRTVCVNSYSDLKTNLMFLVKALEDKYGGGVQEKQEDLGEISYYGSYHREMLALYYYAKGANNQRIGEIRVSCAPANKEATYGYIELSYTDYKSRDKATREYKKRDTL